MRSEVVNRKVKEVESNERIKNKISQIGVHFHRKTQNMAEWNYSYEINQLLNEETLKRISIINMGGGLPSNYANTNVKVINSIFMKIKEFKAYLTNNEIKLMIEPGRFIAAPSGKLHTTIIAIYDKNIIVDVSVYNSDMDALIVPVKLLVEGESNKGEGNPYIIKGITPCSMDLFRYRVYMKKPQVGDELTFLNAGAYNFTTDFCDLERIETEVIE